MSGELSGLLIKYKYLLYKVKGKDDYVTFVAKKQCNVMRIKLVKASPTFGKHQTLFLLQNSADADGGGELLLRKMGQQQQHQLREWQSAQNSTCMSKNTHSNEVLILCWAK